MRAACQCGQLSAALDGTTPFVVACHCTTCQRRSGSPFGVLAYHAADRVRVTGEATSWSRIADSGNAFENFFCPRCGSTVYVRSAKHAAMIGVPVGAIADPSYPPPLRSVWEQSRHHWVVIEAAQHFPAAPA